MGISITAQACNDKPRDFTDTRENNPSIHGASLPESNIRHFLTFLRDACDGPPGFPSDRCVIGPA